ncbi:MAG: T9SS type A sorting domain-containing protein, partial [Bacteroidetes bacterium]|nr:T9SS type A sorting domain-containing protein [Bacteroidota bacterium]
APATPVAAGAWSMQLTSVLSETTHSLTATHTAAAGNTSLVSSAVTLVVNDTTPPAAPVVTAPASPTNDTTPVISGTASEDGGTITLTSDIDGVLAPTATVTGGTWSIQLTSVLSVATHSITATHTDAAGNTSPVSGAVTLVVNNPPAAVASDVQSGTTTFTSVSTDVTIASVDLTKSFLVFSYTVDDEGPSQFLVRGDLTSSTNIHFERAGATGSPIVTIAWYVAEFTSGVTVQRGNDPNNTETVNIPITAVDLSESFPLISWQNTGSTWGDDDGPRARLTSSTNLELDAVRVISGNVNWQVIEYDGAVVQRGQHTLGTADVSATVAIAAVDLAKSFVIVSNTNGASGFPDDLGIQAEFSATNQLTFTRGSTGPLLEINWVVVEFTDAESVQSGSATFGAGATVSNIPITSVDLSKSIAFLSQHQRGGQGNVATPDNPGHVWFAADLTCSTTNLQLTRALGSSGSTAEVEWFVVEFSGSSDTTSPTAPVVTAPASPTNDTTPVISGTASENGGTITLTSDLDGVLAPTTSVAAGAWSITLTTVLSEGTHAITATHTDAAGNTSAASGSATLVVDTTAPAAPAITAPASPTNDTTPVISGTASEDGGTVTLISEIDDVLTLTATVINDVLALTATDINDVLAPTATVIDGAWSIQLTSELNEAIYSITAIHTDAAGNTSLASDAMVLVVDTTPPTPTIASPMTSPTNVKQVPFSIDFGEAIDTTTFDLGDISISSGTAQILVNSGDDQHFTFEVASPTEGALLEVSIAADRLTDAAGTNNLESNTVNLAIDGAPPAVPVIIQPPSPTNDTTPMISGTASEDGGTITLLSDIDGMLIATATVTGGNWSIQLTSELSEATHAITATHTDAAGNLSPSSAARSIRIDITPPTPTIASAMSGLPNTGPVMITIDFGEAIDTATFALSDVSISSGTAQNLVNTGDNRHFTFEVAVPNDGESLTVSIAADQLTDVAGTNNLVSNTLSLTIDRTGPAAPTITAPALPINDTTPVISGTASEDGGTITLTSNVDGILTPTATVTGGVWSIQLTSPLSEATHIITAVHTDAFGNLSPSSDPKTFVIEDTPYLNSNYPNPFRGQTTFSFGISTEGHVSLVVYDLMGRQVRVLFDDEMPAGHYRKRLHLGELSSGVYAYRLVTPNGVFSRLMHVVD